MRSAPLFIVSLFLGSSAILAIVGYGTAQDKPASKAGAKTAVAPAAAKPAVPATKPAAPAVTKPATPDAAKPAAPDKFAADDEAIRLAAATYVKAYTAGDAKGVAAHFTADAEYVDEQGHVLQGRESIEKALVSSFAAAPGSKLEATVESIRFIGPGAAVEDGTAIVTPPGGAAPVHSRYTAMHLKSDGKWLIASVRDQALSAGRQHRAQIEALSWLAGEWVDEGPDSVMFFSCRLSDNGNYLLRDFTIKVAGKEAMDGTQRIGWDPMTGRLRAWTFDSEGGFSEGVWHREGDNWVLKSTGVTADGESSSATSTFASVNPHTMTWQAFDVVVGGVRLPDTGLVKVVRKPPQPKHAPK